MNLLRADVTANNTDDQTLLKRFSLFGPPGIIFFDQRGNEVLRVVGYESADTFLRSASTGSVRQASDRRRRIRQAACVDC